ncbi:DUF3025 domain-containing protein [Ramlibacter sp.]|uniref:DUF3025 domain-containing protein n=1 Tax=Ramlibacter sp. TaxID=1917967 RepID=UPI002B7D7905|nr:DUF3025 domain-containing protein [Ramlibacter sp.]HWI84255.1 DUF3025 domain-containing protein [Ramlibacter sp.]
MFAGIDWQAPWYEPWGAAGGPVARRIAAGAGVADALNGQGAAVRFVPPSELPPGRAYEQFIFERRACPTRDNLHDFFNGLCWIAMPGTKARLNELQAQQIAQAGVGAVRGPVRDAITIFDENGAVLQAPPPLWEALLARQWRRLFVELRALWRQARLTIVGHALLEKLVQPRKDLTAHVLALPAPAGPLPQVDRWLAGALTPPRLAAKPFAPLPVLGVPGWWPENQNFSFYDDSFVFRAAGTKKLKTTAPPAPPRP